MDEQVQKRDLWARQCVCVCVCVDYCDVNNNSFCSPVALSAGEVARKSSFLQTKHNAKGEEMSFIFKALSHSTDYIPLPS